MNQFKLIIKLGNAAMQEGPHVATALREVANKIEDLGDLSERLDAYDMSGKIRDENGNTVGQWKLN